MELKDAIRSRRSIRRYSDASVSKADIAALVDAAAQAPSSLNLQPWHFTVAAGSWRDRVAEVVSKSTVYLQDVLATFDAEHRATAERFICDLGSAPVIVVVSMPKEEEPYNRLTALVGVGCAVENLQLAAADMGLGSCHLTFAFWVRDELSQLLSLGDREIVSIILVGHPEEAPEAPPREGDVATYLGFEGE